MKVLFLCFIYKQCTKQNMYSLYEKSKKLCFNGLIYLNETEAAVPSVNFPCKKINLPI